MKIKIVDKKGNITERLLDDILKENERTLIYFYPKDNTPGCSIEASDFSQYKELLNKNNIGIIGVSKDSCKSHIKFIDKKGLTIDLISDEDLQLHNKFSIIGEKKNYGKIYQGVIRSTFLLDREGKILQEWRNVRAKGHAERLIKELVVK